MPIAPSLHQSQQGGLAYAPRNRAALITMQLLLLLTAALALQLGSAELEITRAERQVQATTQRVASNTVLMLKNTGAAVDEVIVCEQAALKERAAMFEVGVVAGDKFETLGRGTPVQPAGVPAGISCAAYKHTIAKGGKAEVAVKAIFTGVLQPHPEAIVPAAPQRVALSGLGLYVASPYKILGQTTTLDVGSGKVEEYTKAEAAALKGGKLTYGPYGETAPFAGATETVEVHFENNSPFAMAKDLVREIEISHWGNVYFEERYQLTNAGAKVKGEWSRLDYMAREDYGRHAVRELHAVLLPGSHSLYYRDGIGNISSSAARDTNEGVFVALAPRYPLFGGWSADFLFGWSMPLPVAVQRNADGTYALNALVGAAVGGVVVDQLEVRVVLPESASFVGVDCKLDLDVSFDKKYTYFDTAGRTVVVLRKRNVVPEMNVPFTLTYRYPLSAMLRKPLLLVAGFALLFAALMSYSRSSFSINGAAEPVKQKTS